jgi:two-component system response regulator AtoC
VIAHAIHTQSLRNNYPFIKVNCAAIPETLIESEFFGHEKGSFTGAQTKRLGRFELANQGTLLLDEVTEIPIGIQAKLLRAIQEQEFERVGGTKLIKVDTRIISTSNRDIKEALGQKLLREDLYYRLNVVPIHLPPLRERPEDIIPLSEYFLEKFSIENHKSSIKSFSDSAKKKLLEYTWPGNIRELANVIERTVVMDYGKEVLPEHLSIEGNSSQNSTFYVGMTLGELEKRLIIETLEAQNQNRTKTAEVLGISIRTLRNKLNEFDE